MLAITGIVLLVIAGAALLAAEVFVLPGVVLPGVVGTVCLGGASVWAFVGLGPLAGAGVLMGATLATLGLGFTFARSATAKRMILEAAHQPLLTEGNQIVHVGDYGVAATPLRPAGKAEIAGLRLDVRSDGIYVDAGARVRVVEVVGNRVMVAPVVESKYDGSASRSPSEEEGTGT